MAEDRALLLQIDHVHALDAGRASHVGGHLNGDPLPNPGRVTSAAKHEADVDVAVFSRVAARTGPEQVADCDLRMRRERLPEGGRELGRDDHP